MLEPTPVDLSQPVSLVTLGSPERPFAPLPVSLTSFVGREHEVATVAELVRRDDVRLLTLTGPGGVGKTRLALRVAEQAAPAFADGVAFAPLAPVVDPALIASPIAQALGLRDSGDRPLGERLTAYLRERRLLLLLDNMEQVVTAAPFVAGLLAACRGLTVLATSRVTLNVSGEHTIQVAPLPVPGAGQTPPAGDLAASPAARLFVERARAAKPDLAFGDPDAAAIAEICRRLDGLPLAIELAAARANVLSPRALLARLGDRLPLLTGGPRDAPERLRTMRDAIAWSHGLLTPEEQSLFRRLAVFAGGCTLEAAEAVCGTADGQTDRRTDGIAPDDPSLRLTVSPSVLDGVSSLVDKSLLRLESHAGEERFAMLETIREYGLGQLAGSDEEPSVRRRYARWCLDLAEQAWPAFTRRVDQERWLDRFETEHDNLRAALRWLDESGDRTNLLDLAGRLFWFWYVHGHWREGRAWLERALAACPDGPVEARARALLGVGLIAHFQGDDERAVPALRESARHWRDLDMEGGFAYATALLGVVAEDSGQFAQAVPLLEEAIAAARAADDPNASLILDHLGVVAWGQGDADRAIPYWEEALAHHRLLGDTWAASISLSYLGLVACDRGEFARAEALHRESLEMRWAMRSQEDVAHCLANLAALATARGDRRRAARLFGAAEAVQETIGNTLKEPERSVYARWIARTRGGLDDATFRSAWEAGRNLSLEEAVAEALAAPAAPAEAAQPAVKAGAALGLTAREVEVLHLLVAGHSDREIGDALFISWRTAQGHVASILAKLGVNSRTAAVGAALRAGLTGGDDLPVS